MKGFSDTEKTILKLVEDNAVRLPKDIERTTHLIRSGILDSLGVVHISSAIENKYDIKIPEREINPSNFTSITSIANVIIKYTNSTEID